MPITRLSFESGESSLSVRRYAVREALSTCFTAHVWARSPEPTLDLGALIGRPAALRLEGGRAFALLGDARTWSGVCASIEQSRVEPSGLSTYHLTIRPRLWVLSHRRNHRLFQHQSIPEMTELLLGEWGIDAAWNVDASAYPKLELRVQYGESDLDFLSRLWEEAGIAFTFPDGETLLLSDALHEGPPRAAPPIPFVDHPNQDAETEFVTRVRLGHEVRPGAEIVRDHDFRKPSFTLTGEAPKAAAPEQRLEQYRYAPGAFLIEVDEDEDGTPVADQYGVTRHRREHGHQRATRSLGGRRAGKRAVAFESNAVDLAPGVVFAVDGHLHPEVDGKPLLVSEMRYEGTEGGSRTMSGGALPAEEPYRPPARTPKPVIRSVQSATVVGAGEIHTDEFGRVKVHFPWDRSEERTSCWMRVSQGWAGSRYGMMDVPRVGQEVLVAFIDGNPDQPVVIGRLYNQQRPVPYPLPEQKTRSGWKSDSSPGSGGLNEIMFEDKAGDELVFEQAERNRRTLVKNDEAITVGHDRHHDVAGDQIAVTDHDRTEVTGRNRSQVVGASRTTVVGGDKAKKVGGQETEEVAGDQTVLVAKDRHSLVKGEERELILSHAHLHVKGNENVQVSGCASLGTTSLQVDVGGKAAIETGDELHFASNELFVGEGVADVTLKGPGGFVRIDASGVTIMGTLVLINAGGSAGSGAGAHPTPPLDPKDATAAREAPAPPVPNPPHTNPPAPAAPAWTPADLRANIDRCDGGTGIWASARAANGGRDPVVQTGASVIGSGGSVDTSTGTITLDPTQDRCTATQVEIQELTNLSHKPDFDRANADAAAGNLSREDYIRANERAEYDGVRNVIRAFDACKDRWGCTTCEKEWARRYTTFEDYYDHALSNDHKEYYGRVWDANYRAAYRARHPAGHP